MKIFRLKYQLFKRVSIFFVVLVFGYTSFASDFYACICHPEKEVNKKMDCCSEEKDCCGKPMEKPKKDCSVPQKKSNHDCNKCEFKISDVENPVINSNQTINLNTFLIAEENISLNSGYAGLLPYNVWHPPNKSNKIYLSLSNFRI